MQIKGKRMTWFIKKKLYNIGYIKPCNRKTFSQINSKIKKPIRNRIGQYI